MRASSRVSRIFVGILSLTALVSVGLIAGCSPPEEEKSTEPTTQDGKPVPPEAKNAPAAGGFEGKPKMK